MNSTITKNTTKTAVNAIEATQANEMSKVGIGALGVSSGIIGIWGVACMVGGLVEAGGPISLFKSWVGALIGV
jgi:hypothetical protein